MSPGISFLRPSLVPRSAYQEYLDSIDESHLYSNYGPLNTLFEERVLAECFQGEGAVTTVTNATIGLMLAISDVKRPGARYAVMPSFTFAATPLAAQWCGLEPYFVDVCPDSWCMDIAKLEEALEILGDDVAVVVPYATFGTAMELAPFRTLHARGIPVVVDAASSFGTENSCGHFGRGFPGLLVFSFHATKAFCIGEGGLIYSGDTESIGRIRSAGNFGFSAERESIQKGLNSKVSEYCAAIALATLAVFPEKIAKRQRIHGWYLEELQQRDLLREGWLVQASQGQVPWQFMSVLSPKGARAARMEKLSQAGVECRTYFAPSCHQQPQFSACPHGNLQTTEDLSRRILSLPLWEQMTPEDVRRIMVAL